MKIVFKISLLLSFLYPQSGNFNITNGNGKDLVYSASFWLGGSQMIDPNSTNRLFVQTGLSSIYIEEKSNFLKYPNIDVGLKVTKNLSLTCKSYGFQSVDENPQVIGGGIQYYSGDKDTLNWSTSLQRVDLKGLKHFHMTSLLLDFRKWFGWNNYKFRIGTGTILFKERSFSGDHGFPSSMEGQINFLGIDLMIPMSILTLGMETRISSSRIITSLYMQKEIF